jgi:hypothetical protein
MHSLCTGHEPVCNARAHALPFSNEPACVLQQGDVYRIGSIISSLHSAIAHGNPVYVSHGPYAPLDVPVGADAATVDTRHKERMYNMADAYKNGICEDWTVPSSGPLQPDQLPLMLDLCRQMTNPDPSKCITLLQAVQHPLFLPPYGDAVKVAEYLAGMPAQQALNAAAYEQARAGRKATIERAEVRPPWPGLHVVASA